MSVPPGLRSAGWLTLHKDDDLAGAQKDTARRVSRLGLDGIGRPLATCFTGPKVRSACLRSWTARGKSYMAAVIWARSEETNVSSNPSGEGQAIIAQRVRLGARQLGSWTGTDLLCRPELRLREVAV